MMVGRKDVQRTIILRGKMVRGCCQSIMTYIIMCNARVCSQLVNSVQIWLQLGHLTYIYVSFQSMHSVCHCSVRYGFAFVKMLLLQDFLSASKSYYSIIPMSQIGCLVDSDHTWAVWLRTMHLVICFTLLEYALIGSKGVFEQNQRCYWLHKFVLHGLCIDLFLISWKLKAYVLKSASSFQMACSGLDIVQLMNHASLQEIKVISHRHGHFCVG